VLELIGAIFLGVVQGLTEFLPVSSSGHLLLGQYFLGLDQDRFGLTFDAAIHTGTVLAVVGYVLFTVPGVISTFATPAIGAAYLNGHPDVMNLEFSAVMSAIFGLGLLFAVVGNAVLSVAIWRSGVLPKWSGLLWLWRRWCSTFSAQHSEGPPPGPVCPPSQSALLFWRSAAHGSPGPSFEARPTS